MNDFTIDELEDMLAGLGHVLDRVANDEPIINLQNKLKLMIENYCDHDFVPCLAKINIDMCKHPKCLAIK